MWFFWLMGLLAGGLIGLAIAGVSGLIGLAVVFQSARTRTGSWRRFWLGLFFFWLPLCVVAALLIASGVDMGPGGGGVDLQAATRGLATRASWVTASPGVAVLLAAVLTLKLPKKPRATP